MSAPKVHGMPCCTLIWQILKAGVDGKDYVRKRGSPVLITDVDRGEKGDSLGKNFDDLICNM